MSWAACRPVPRPAASTYFSGQAPAAAQPKPESSAARGLPPLKITDIPRSSPPQPGPAGGRQGLDQRAGPLRPGLRHVHPAGPRRADGRREVPEALPHRPRRRPDRGHLAVVLRQLVLAERAGAVQRDERRGHGALGHQGQAGQYARLSTAGRQVPVRRRVVCPVSGRDIKQVEESAAPRWPRAIGISASRWVSRGWRLMAPPRPTSPRQPRDRWSD